MIKILAIDDNNDNLISLKAILKDVFPEVVVLTALNGPRGIELAEAENPDVILLDIVMPGMDGFEVCGSLKKNERVCDIPVVFLTALKGDRANRIKALEYGAEGFLAKPIDEPELIAQVRAMVKIKSANLQKKVEKQELERQVAERTSALEQELVKRQSAEASVRKTENHFRALIDKAPDGVALIDASGKFIFISPAAKKMFGFAEDLEDYGKPHELTHPEDLSMVLDELGKLFQEPSYSPTLQYRFATAEGDYKWIESTFSNMLANPDIQAIIINFRDINERKIAEERSKESEYFFKESQRAAFVGSYRYDLQKNHWTSSEVLEQIFGIESDYDRSFQGWLDLAHPEDLEMMSKYFTEAVVGKGMPFNKEYRIIRKSDGEVRWVLGLGKLSTDANGNIQSMTGTIQDITDRIQVREALNENENKYRELFEANTDSIAIFLITGEDQPKFIDCNENNALLLGYSKEELFNLSPEQVEIRVSEEELRSRIRELQGRGQVSFETKLIHKSGRLIDVEIKAKVIKYKNQLAGMNISRDITNRKQQEESLKQSNELNNSLLQAIPFGIDIVDEEGNILFMSENLKKNVGNKSVGCKCWELFCDDRLQCEKCPLMSGIKIGDTKWYEAGGLLGGKTFQISHTGMVFHGQNAMLEIFQDITEKKEVEKKLKLLAYALESIGECVTITDNDDKIIYVNKSFIHTYGYSYHELMGQHTSILRSPDIAFEHVRDILPVTIEGGWSGEIMNRKKDGSLFPIFLSTSIIKDEFDKPIALIGVARDITENRKSRAELIAAKDMAEESNRLKTAFLNNMSHEIRTPMNHIMGFSSLMAEVQGTERDEFAQIILKSSNQLLTLIENVILLSRLQSEISAISKNEINPGNLITSLGKIFGNDCLKKNIGLHLRIPQDHLDQSILSDQEKIKLILTNLISNAIKYTLEGFVEVGYELHEKEIKFYVKDSGLGIPLKEQEKVFDSFYRSEQALSMAIGGTGLGLSIVRELVKALGGTLQLESEPGKGSSFNLTIPVEHASKSRVKEEILVVDHLPLQEVTILIADDEQINFLYFEILLKKSVKKLDHAGNGKIAVAMAAKTKYDLIFMDLKMPILDGYEATKLIKQRHPTIPVIAQTAYATAEEREKALLAGCDDFIPKPMKKNLLLEMIQKYS